MRKFLLFFVVLALIFAAILARHGTLLPILLAFVAGFIVFFRPSTTRG